MCNIRFWELSFWLFNLFTLGRKFDSSRLNVTERDAKEFVHTRQQGLGRRSFGSNGGFAFEQNDAVGEVGCHDEIVFNHESGLLRV